MRLGIVVQRYGLEVNGGAEMQCRHIAERMARHMDVEIVTTCAQDYHTWRNVYRSGIDSVNGIPVRRFPVQRERDMAAFDAFSAKLLGRPHSYFDQLRWMELQGPDAPELFRYIEAEGDRYGALLFSTYLYATTYVGLQLAPRRAILLANAHDDHWLRLGLYRPLFHLPAAFIFNSPEERDLIHRTFRNEHIPGQVFGSGVDTARLAELGEQARAARPDADSVTGGAPYIIYVGRVDPSKGCDELFEHFFRFKAETSSPLKLVLVGGITMPVPQHEDIVALGFLPHEPYELMAQATALVLPSRVESLSIVVLEALALGVPVLVNGQCEVLQGHCRRGNAGFYYCNYAEFRAFLTLLAERPDLVGELGRNGQQYVRHNYRWESLEDRFVHWFTDIARIP
jgi:glycosyltransferase involved in cell wall biosynthesis